MATEVLSSKDLEGLFQAMIFCIGLWKNKRYDHNKLYYVIQGPNYHMAHFYRLNFNRTKLEVGCDPNDNEKTSPVYLSNYPEFPNALKCNVHYGSLRTSQTSNKLGEMIFPLPDFGKIEGKNEIDTAYSEPNKDLINSVIKKGY